VGGQRTYFFYAQEGLVGEYTYAGSQATELKTYGYFPGSIWTTNPLFQKVGEEYYWYINDHLGTPQKMVDGSGSVVWEATYVAFGKATVGDGATIEDNLRFPGQYFDGETGLHYNWFRYYSAETGKYFQPDPLFDQLNLFSYSRNTPTMAIDPWGLIVEFTETGESLRDEYNRIAETDRGAEIIRRLEDSE